MARSMDVSSEYLVWLDREPESADKAWGIYAKRIADDPYKDGGHFMARRTNVVSASQASFAVSGKYLVFEDDTDSGTAIFLLDLDRRDPPVPVVVTEDPHIDLNWPAISEYYVVWAEMDSFFERRILGIRLEDGQPVGEPFQVSSPGSGGSWPSISRNVVVWNGATSFFNGPDVLITHRAIVAAELPLPGADDLGDADFNGQVELSDAVVILNNLFGGGWKPRLRVADVDQDGELTLADAIRVLRYLFRGEPL